jgi:hypothetical protein
MSGYATYQALETRAGWKEDSRNTNKKFWAEQWVHKPIERVIGVLEKMEKAYPG